MDARHRMDSKAMAQRPAEHCLLFRGGHLAVCVATATTVMAALRVTVRDGRSLLRLRIASLANESLSRAAGICT